MRLARSVMPASPSESLLVAPEAWRTSNPTPSSLTRSRSPSCSKLRPIATRFAAACRSMFDIASWAMRNSASSTVGSSAPLWPGDSKRSLEPVTPARLGEDLADGGDQSQVVEDRGPQPLGDGAQLHNGVLGNSPEVTQRQCLLFAGINLGFHCVDLPAKVDERLNRTVVEFLCQMSTLLLLTRNNASRIRLHQIVPASFSGHVLKYDLHPGPAHGPPQHGRRGPVQNGMPRALDGDRFHSLGGGTESHVATCRGAIVPREAWSAGDQMQSVRPCRPVESGAVRRWCRRAL